MNKKHKHAELIKAWADGAEIEESWEAVKNNWSDWVCFSGFWNDDVRWNYRIKPEPKPDVVKYLMTDDKECGNLTSYEDRLFTAPQSDEFGNLYEQIKIIRDGFGKLKSAEVLK